MLKIVFFGTPHFAVESLDALTQAGCDIAAVVTATDKPAGRGHKLQSSPVKQYALEHGLRVLQPQSLKDPDFIDELKSLKADLFIVIAFRMLPEVVWQMPPLGTFNLHASLLPRYRGAAPINHAVINGETKTGVTTFFLKHDIDTGDVIDRVEVEIKPEDNVADVHDRLMLLGAQLTVKTVRAIEDGSLKTIPQSELIAQGEKSCGAPKIFKETCKIEWNRNANEIHNLVRGLSPAPGAWTVLDSTTSAPTEIKIFRTALTHTPSSNVLPGTIVVDNGNMFVATASCFLEVKELQMSGKKRMFIQDFLRGARLASDSKFNT